MVINGNTLDFSLVESPQKLNSEWVLSRLSQEQIFYAYFGEFIPYKKSYNSVFRKDRTASTGFYLGESGKLKYKDMKTGESWDCFSFIAKLYGVSYYQAVKKVACDFGLIKDCSTLPLEKKSINQSFNFDKKAKEEREIQIIPDKWHSDAKNYWKAYEINGEDLQKEHVYPIKKLFIDKKFISNRNNDLRFAYLIPTPKKEYMKIYTPYSQEYKWISNIPLHIPFGMDTLNYDSKAIVVGKSLKDMIVLKKLFPSVLATQNESEGALNKGMVKHLIEKFESRVIVFDNDETGVESCKKFNTKGFDYFNIPREYIYEGIKDPSDFIKAYGLEKLKNLFKQKNLL